nr:MAG TPA: hypothetical protein [Caudoviricetes sp.]
MPCEAGVDLRIGTSVEKSTEVFCCKAILKKTTCYAGGQQSL